MQDDLVDAALGPLFSRAPDPAYAFGLDASGNLVLVRRNPAAESLDCDEHASPGSPVLEDSSAETVRAEVLACLREQVAQCGELDWTDPRTGVRRHLLLAHTPVADDLAVTSVRDLTGLFRALDEQRERAEELAELTNLTRSLLEPDDPQSVRDAFCRAALRLAGADAVYLAEPRGNALVQVAKASAPGMPDHPPVRIPLADDERSVTREAFLGATNPFMTDFDKDPRADAELARSVGAASGFYAPVVSRGRLLGELLVAWRHPLPAPPERVMRLMPVLAADAAAAISRADLIARLDDAAQSDPLTALPNRRASEAQLDRHVAHAQRTGAAFSVAVLDIDGLKEVNDREGHEAGDELLRRAADAWRHAVRREDQLARVGGDEFVLLMPDTDEAEARHAAERVRATAPGVPVAVGVSQWRRGESPQQVLARADERMYAEKALHRKQ